MLKNLAFSALLAAVAASAFAQPNTAIQAPAGHSAYLQDSRGTITRSQFGLCWRTGDWTPADAVAGCDGELVPPIAKPTAPPIVPPVAMQPKPPATPAPAPKPCDFSVTLGNDQAFAFNRIVLSSAAKKQIDTDVLDRLPNCARIDSILVTGHADRLGSQQYNQKLSEQRANAVATYLRSKGVASAIDILGAGKTQPIKSCGNNLRHRKLIECLAPNRRVLIEVHGITK